MNHTAQTQPAVPYTVERAAIQATGEDAVIAEALAILARRLQPGAEMNSPSEVKKYLALRAAHYDREVFGCLWLDVQNRVIDTENLFFGTLTQTSVYPREVVRSAMRMNAAAVVLTHNHPSGNPKPSRADEALTKTLKEALAMVDCRVLDHIITAGGQSQSMAEMGLI